MWAAALLLVLAVSTVERFEDGSFVWHLAGLVLRGCLPWGLCAYVCVPDDFNPRWDTDRVRQPWWRRLWSWLIRKLR